MRSVTGKSDLEPRCSGRTKRKVVDHHLLDHDAWPGLEEALRASMNPNPRQRRPTKRQRPTAARPKATKCLAREESTYVDCGKRVSPKVSKPSKVLGKVASTGGGKHKPSSPTSQLVRRTFSRIVEPKTARIGEGLAGLGMLLTSSYLCHCSKP